MGGGIENKPGGTSLVDQQLGGGAPSSLGPGKRTLTEQLTPSLGTQGPNGSAAGGHGLPPSIQTRAEASLGTNLSGVRVHEDGVAERHDSKAVAQDKDLHFAAGEYRPNSPAGQFMIAHELAHVAQQDGGAVATQAFEGPGVDSTHGLEAEANAAAPAILAGTPASVSRGSARRGAIQGFDSPEHQLVGDAGSGGQTYAFGPGKTSGQGGAFELTHGDIVMLSGDYFDEHDDGKGRENSLFDLASRSSGNPGTQLNTQDEVIAAIKVANPEDPRFKPGGLWAALKISDDVKKSVDNRYRRLAMRNAEHFQAPVAGKEHYQMRESGGGTYRAMHEEALLRAYKAGKEGGDVSMSMAHEAAGQHFLTDEFSSGHIRTPRESVQQYWNDKYPQFKANFVQVLGRLIGEALADDRAPAAVALPEPVLIASAQGKAAEAVGAAGPPGLGDLLSLLFHDTDNDVGLKVGNDLGWEWTALGDTHIKEGGTHPGAGGRSHFDIIKLAVELGCNDVQRAYQIGASESTHNALKDIAFERVAADSARVLASVRQSSPAPTKPGAKYAPEQLVPRVISSVNGELNWKAATFEELLGKALRTDIPDVTVRDALVASCQSGAIFHMMESTAFSQDVYAKVVGITVGYPYQAFRDGVVLPLKADPLKFFYAILNNSDLRSAKPHGHRPERPL